MSCIRLRHLSVFAFLSAVIAVAVCLAPGAQAARPAHRRVDLLDQSPIPAVQEAVTQADLQAPVPAGITPAAVDPNSAYLASECLPTFGPGTTYSVCSMGAAHSRRTVVLLGDSHAWMWAPAFASAGTELDFRLVPLTKPGCALWALNRNRPGWPCLTWYSSVLRTIRRLHPAATIVSFMTSDFTVGQATAAANYVHSVMRAVPNPVLLADPPSDDWYPAGQVPTPSQCLSSPGATLGSCALHVSNAIKASLTHIQAMVNHYRYPAIPTLQWFCANRVCPTVIDGTMTSWDGNHITAEYARILAPRLANQLRPILRSLARAKASASRR